MAMKKNEMSRLRLGVIIQPEAVGLVCDLYTGFVET